MIEHDWLTGTDALTLLDHLYPVRGLDSVEPQSRASRLYLLACARRGWGRLPGVCRAVAAVGERVYHNRVTDRRLRNEVYPLAEELTHCRGEANRVNAVGRALVDLGHADAAAVWADFDCDPDEWTGFAHLAYFPFSPKTPHYPRVPADLHSADLVREVFGNPFVRHDRFDRAWRSPNVAQLARHAHATADFSVLPVLADALEEAGCDRADILSHLRSAVPHARGCWALELVLE
jgi:hypothetical protein